MLETPSLAYAPERFFAMTDFISVGGNDLKQFFFAADRENELVRRRYDMLSSSFLGFLEQIVGRCAAHGTPLSFCGEDAGRPLEALGLAAIGFRSLSMRPASIGPVKALLRKVDLSAARGVIDRPPCRRGQRPAGARGLAAGPPPRRTDPPGTPGAEEDRMIQALTLLFVCQLMGEVIVQALGITFPGPVLGMGLLFAGLLAFGRSAAPLDAVADTILLTCRCCSCRRQSG